MKDQACYDAAVLDSPPRCLLLGVGIQRDHIKGKVHTSLRSDMRATRNYVDTRGTGSKQIPLDVLLVTKRSLPRPLLEIFR